MCTEKRRERSKFILSRHKLYVAELRRWSKDHSGLHFSAESLLGVNVYKGRTSQVIVVKMEKDGDREGCIKVNGVQE